MTVSTRALTLLADARRARRRELCTRWRRLDAGRQALLVVAYLRTAAQKDVNTTHARLRGPGERANAQFKSWKILRKVRSSPN